MASGDERLLPPVLFDLQLFAEDSPTGQKTEEATPWKREEAQRRGQVAKSADLSGVLILLACFLGLYAGSAYMLGALADCFRRIPLEAARGAIDVPRAYELGLRALYDWIVICLPVLAASFGAGYLANVAQVGFIFTFEPMEFNPGRLNPVSGMQRIFSMSSLNELAKSLVKIGAVAYLPWRFIEKETPTFLRMIDAPVGAVIEAVSRLAFELSLQVIFVLLVLAVIDYAYQRYEFEQSIKMSRYDIQQEMKQHDGDPNVKAAIRRRMAQMARKSLAKEVPKADVVVTNPEHYAVALRYRQEEGDAAPTCVAKGTNAVAQRIKEIARENNVTVYENPPLARTLYAEVEAGEMIPEKLFVAVAEVLAFVYKRKRGRA